MVDVAKRLNVTRRSERIDADDRRVVARPFVVENEMRVRNIIGRIVALDDAQVGHLLAEVLADFKSRHRSLERTLRKNCEVVAAYLPSGARLSDERRMLIGAYFTMEYSVEAAALFNPSIVPHPDQSGVPGGGARFIMSLRATGEGHISSIVFRTGMILADGEMHFDAPSPFRHTATIRPDGLYDRHTFTLKLKELAALTDAAEMVLAELGEEFTLQQLEEAVDRVRGRLNHGAVYNETTENMLWLARSNYHLHMPEDSDVSETVIFPTSTNESRGIEDARFVRFTDDDGAVAYLGTYTAYNGFRILPQLIETEDFHHFSIHTLNGRYVQNKGMALFPRRIDGNYVMISRLDGESMYIMYSDNIHFWNECCKLQSPRYPWEFVQIGNNGSPIETEAGWLLLTHGVGPMREYSMGATLLDRDDPTRVIGQLREPLLEPNEQERNGYVPNVVYSCGSMVHNGILYIPYAMSDTASTFATVPLDDLLAELTGG